VGPTASGKSALAHTVALENAPSVELVCVDAMTVYRGMDIGTAKATPEQRAEVSYHMLDLVDPSDEFTVAAFQQYERDVRFAIWKRDHAVLYVGGTGLYARAVFDDLEIPGQYPAIRHELEERAKTDVESLYQELVTLDPLAASRMEPSNERRLVRALEVCRGSGRPFSSFGPGLESYENAGVAQVGLRRSMEDLDARIEERFHEWLAVGLLEEVRRLAAFPGGLSRTARQAVGYKELLAHVENDVPLEQCVEDAITASRRLARRQRSWFERDPRIEWFDDDEAAVERLLQLLTGVGSVVRD
jgi:tRNA dimethylallyltransferase